MHVITETAKFRICGAELKSVGQADEQTKKLKKPGQDLLLQFEGKTILSSGSLDCSLDFEPTALNATVFKTHT